MSIPRKVAIVDDNETTLTWLKEVLEGAGYEVVSHSASFGIMSFVVKTKPELLLLDVNMPALSGNVVCNLLRERPETAKLCIVLHSSMEEDALRAATQACGANAYVLKSSDPTRLLSTVRMQLLTRVR